MRPLRGAFSGVKGVRTAVLFSLMTCDWELPLPTIAPPEFRLLAIGLL